MMPRIGQQMNYFPSQRGMGDQPWLALVAFVHDEHKVNLAIFDPNGALFAKGRGVLVVHDGEPEPGDGMAYCTFA